MITNVSEKEKTKILGMEIPYFMAFAVIVMLAVYFDFLPGSLAGQIPFLLILGELLRFVGDRIPIVKDYLGGGSVVVLFGCSALVMFGLIPEATVAATKQFIAVDFMDFALAALCCGSIFGMDRNMLIKSAIRYIPCILGGVIVAGLLCGLVGSLFGYGFSDSILFIALPIMGGGTSAGAVPMSKMFAEVLGKDPGNMLAVMTPAVALGNAIAIISAGFLDKLGKSRPALTGNGDLMRDSGKELVAEKSSAPQPITDLSVFATGMTVAGILLALGKLVQSFVPSVHAYAWMILIMIIIKAIGILPEKIEKSCELWYQFVVKNFSNLILAALGIGVLSLQPVIEALTPLYLLLVIVTVFGAMIGSAIVGHFVGFYPIEAAITGGLCMANMGGSGDIATLGACNRMKLMPFAAVSSRLGGALILILGSLILPLLT